ncbi:hypothetical protein [Elizabethkingia argenteiflava]|uniref:hypothetical protein n=1 Tax=Elizabethkingia argenteiflava TaxID=2681556 RepID=UPI001FCEE5CF|nr:hypothetical protein [Elizabethkingia argenteiflava]
MNNKRKLERSNIQLDGSHTRSRRDGESVGYQSRKPSGITNSIFLCDNQGPILSLSEPMSGHYHDVYKIEDTMEEILYLLKKAAIEYKGLFLNKDAGFDSGKFRNLLYQKGIIANIKNNPRHG